MLDRTLLATAPLTEKQVMRSTPCALHAVLRRGFEMDPYNSTVGNCFTEMCSGSEAGS